MTLQQVASLAAIILTLVAYLPYIRRIRAGRARPHVFSWVIWSITTCVVFFAQLAAEGGVGAWPTGVSGLITLYVAVLAWMHRADITITRSDWTFLLLSISSLPVWFLTADPLWSVLILTTVDALGFGPTLRKAWHFPQQESLPFYALFALRSGLSIIALESLNLTTLLFPVTMVIGCIVACLLLWWRGRVVLGRDG